jgi:hypothetical protein
MSFQFSKFEKATFRPLADFPGRLVPGPLYSEKESGWGGRIRTFTVLINSEVSYQLDHAPAGVARLLRGGPESAGETCKTMKNTKRITWSLPSARAE